MDIYTCDNCKTDIKLKVIRGYVHVTCPICKKQYQLNQDSLKKYLFLPFICVGTSVGASLYFLEGKSIDIKFIFIITSAFVLSAMLGYIFTKLGWLVYEEKEEDR